MTAIIWCKDKQVLTLSGEPIPRIGEQIVVERNGRKIYRVENVLWSYHFILSFTRCPMPDHRIEIQVSEVA